MQKARGHNPKIAPTLCKRTVSGTISLPAKGYFSPFPHGTCSLSVAEEYLALGGGPPRFRQNSTCSAVLGNAVQRASSLSPTGLLPSPAPLSRGVRLAEEVFYSSKAPSRPPTTPHYTGQINDDGLLRKDRFRLFPFRSPLLRESRLFSVPAVTEMFQFTAFAPAAYVFSGG
jgi:hypothetical protein